MQKYTKHFICQLAEHLGINDLPENWSGIDAVVPIIHKIQEEGAIFIIKFDGERDKNPYTILIHGKQLTEKESFIRIDTDNLDNGICHVIGEYAKAIWGNDITKIPTP